MSRHQSRWLALAGVAAFVGACSGIDGSEPVGTTTEPVSFAGGDNDGYCASNPSAGCWEGTPLPAKTLALTFDDGPGSQTSALSTYLKSKGIRATFFVNGKNIGAGGATLLAQLVADGHLVGNHTQNHADLTTLSDAAIVKEIADTDAIIAPYVPNRHFVFRAPYGMWSAHDYAVVHASAMDKYVGPVKWDLGGTMSDIYGADWDCWQNADGYGVLTTKQCGDRHFRQIADVGRGIVLMHDADYGDVNNHSLTSGKGNTVDLVKYLLDGSAALGVTGLLAQGYKFVRVDEVPDIAAAFPAASDGGAGDGGDAGACAWNPTWAETTYANEWWVEYTITGATWASFEVVGGATVNLTSSYGKWVGPTAARVPSGTSAIVHAKNAAGQSAQTKPFPYLVTMSPTTSCAAACVPSCGAHVCGDDGCGGSCGTCAAGQTCNAGACTSNPCSGAWVPTWSQGSGANTWWVEYAVGGGTAASVYLEVVGKSTVPLTLQWGKWVGPSSAKIASGTSVVVHAQNTAGQSAQTTPFGYLTVTKPTTRPCPQ